MACSLVLWRNDSILRSTNTSQPTPLSHPLRFRPQARYRFSKFSGCFFLRSKLPSPLLFFFPVFPILLSFFLQPGYAIIAQPAEHSSAGNAMRRIVSEIACFFLSRCTYIYIRCVYICRFVGGEKYRRLCGLSRLVCPSVGLGVSHERSTRLKVRGV